MRIRVNGEEVHVAAGDTLGALLARRGADRHGVAVAVDGEVVPRAAWPGTVLADGVAVEVLTAVQGG